MNIDKIKTAFKVADVLLDKDHGIRHIKFVFLNELFDEKGNKIDKKILSDNAGRIYLIVVDDKVMKIGGSQCKGGIRNTLSFYQGGMQGGPSIRTYGIHILLKEELEKGKKVEVFMINSQKTKMKVKGLFNEGEMEVSAFKDMEDKCKQDYVQEEGSYPPWNLQEKGEPWREDIIRDWNIHGSKRKVLNKKIILSGGKKQ